MPRHACKQASAAGHLFSWTDPHRTRFQLVVTNGLSLFSLFTHHQPTEKHSTCLIWCSWCLLTYLPKTVQVEASTPDTPKCKSNFSTFLLSRFGDAVPHLGLLICLALRVAAPLMWDKPAAKLCKQVLRGVSPRKVNLCNAATTTAASLLGIDDDESARTYFYVPPMMTR